MQILRHVESHAADASTVTSVREAGPSDFGEWDAFVKSSASGTFCHLSGWMGVVERELGHRPIRLLAERGGKITGVLPMNWVRSRLFGDCLVSLPLAVYGGICADDKESHDCLLACAQERSAKLGVKYLELRNRVDVFPTNLPQRDLYVSFTQDLSPGPDKLLQGLPRDTRYAVRKSLKAGLEWVQALDLSEFYEVYAQSVHRLGTPVFSKKMFTLFLDTFPGQCRIFGVRKNGTTIAAVFCFYFQDQVMPYYGGSLAEYNRDAPNNFMYWNLMTQSCAEGYRLFDFGRSKKGTGAFDFKSSWSMRMTELPYRYHLNRATEVPKMSPVDPKFQAPVYVWKRLPLSWTKVLGPEVIRRIPSV